MANQVNDLAAEELKIINTLEANLASLDESDPNFVEILTGYINIFAVNAEKCLAAQEEFQRQNDEVKQLKTKVEVDEEQVDRARASTKSVVKVKNKEFYSQFLKPHLATFKAILDKYQGVFCNSVDEKAQANYDGINLIYNSFENTLVFSGLHVKEEPKVEEPKVETQADANAQEAKAAEQAATAANDQAQEAEATASEEAKTEQAKATETKEQGDK